MSASPTAVVGVQLGERSYSIRVGSGLLGAPASYQRAAAWQQRGHRQQRDRRRAVCRSASRRARGALSEGRRRHRCATARRSRPGRPCRRSSTACVAAHADRSSDGVRARRRRGRRSRRLRRGVLHARRRLCPGADDAARAGRFVGRRQDRRQPSGRQEPDRRVPPAARGGRRRRRPRVRCRSASWSPGWPRSSSTARSPTTRSSPGSKRACRRCWPATSRRSCRR